MVFKLPEPPEWWVKYKPLRWILVVLVVYWFFGTLLPRLRTEAPAVAEDSVEAPAEVATAETEPAAEITAPPAPPPVAEPVAKPPPPEPEPAKPAPAPPKPLAPAPVAPSPPATVAEEETEPDPAARYTRVEAERVTFMGALRSYDSVSTVRDWLEASGYSASVSTIERDLPSTRYPPYRNDTLVVPEYKHADHEGRLTLEFFNDRLYQAQFMPAQPPQYLSWLRGRGVALPVKRTGRSTVTQGYLRISTNIDFASSDVGTVMGSSPFVLWEDLRLLQQMQDWGPLR